MKKMLFGTVLIVSGTIAIACQPSSNPPTANVPVSGESAATIAAKTTASSPESSFDESLYLFANPDVKKLIKQGKYKSGLEHYEKVGQTAKKADGEDYESFFTGTDGSDTIQGFGKGKHAHFAGIGFEIASKKNDPLPLRPKSLGKGEVDVLVGTQDGGNEFLLGSFVTSVNPKAEPFYIGNGDADYARIQNFTPTKDLVMLAGEPKQYTFKPVAGNLHIATVKGDLVAIVEGIETLTVGDVVKQYGIFTMK
ncbi:MAG: hypothetical protein KME45_00200 [Stenomitos rutilans HA7619-LM2]|nr:hypothetical protein [Stenomitos rutilans HA7619-LM2]